MLTVQDHSLTDSASGSGITAPWLKSVCKKDHITKQAGRGRDLGVGFSFGRIFCLISWEIKASTELSSSHTAPTLSPDYNSWRFCYLPASQTSSQRTEQWEYTPQLASAELKIRNTILIQSRAASSPVILGWLSISSCLQGYKKFKTDIFGSHFPDWLYLLYILTLHSITVESSDVLQVPGCCKVRVMTGIKVLEALFPCSRIWSWVSEFPVSALIYKTGSIMPAS